MQYKTVTIEHFVSHERKESFTIGSKYEKVINQEAANGWKLLGIHPVPIERPTRCSYWFLGRFSEKFEMDILIFFREDNVSTEQYNNYAQPAQENIQKRSTAERINEAREKFNAVSGGIGRTVSAFKDKATEMAHNVSENYNQNAREEKTAICPNCGYQNNTEKDFCEQCGEYLEK